MQPLTATLSKKTVKQRFNSRPQIPDQEKIAEIFLSHYPAPEKTKFGLYKTPIGIEVELENIVNALSIYPHLWTVTEDGSLRNAGLEFVSVPVLGKNIDYALAELREVLKGNNPQATHRCSTHVHVNVSDLDVSQLRYLVATYAIFEEFLFSFVDPIRKHNPFCFPLTSTEYLMLDDLPPPACLKYCALNLGHLGDYGTLEFRHMHGLRDFDQLEKWVQMIQKLVNRVKLVNLSELHEKIWTLNTTSDYASFCERIFYPINPFKTGHKEMMEDGVTWAKMFLHSEEDVLKRIKQTPKAERNKQVDPRVAPFREMFDDLRIIQQG
ncbi:amidoligase family protein [Microcystis sp. M42BS1]|uniref:amidoligase family protein n=1 Tax=Microcystis sp. M42BS1 TaxID=2771192 RepID=UPI002590702F|nr:amidoligase family protein [Microcystis sp. M42BS1]MCA2570678.1 amidoligase family protein [Microcystis sp. M42BS1]